MMVLFPILFYLFACSGCMHLEDDDDRETVEPEYLDMLLKEERYEEFNRLMAIDIPHLSKPRSANATGDPRYSPHLEHGDIVLTPKQKELGRQVIDFSTYGGSKWPSRIVPFTMSSSFTTAQRNVILSAVSEFNKNIGPCLQWKQRAAEKDYVSFFIGNGCWSRLGRTGGAQSLSLDSSGCIYKGTCLHEMSHAIGFIHEQCRSDRNSHIKLCPENIKEDWISQFDIVSSSEYLNLGPYDCYSIMHYPQKHPDVSDNKPAYEVYNKSIDINRMGYGTELTSIDWDKIKKAYC